MGKVGYNIIFRSPLLKQNLSDFFLFFFLQGIIFIKKIHQKNNIYIYIYIIL